MPRVPTANDWDLYGEHLDEAVFRARQWQFALSAAHYSLDDVAAHLEELLFAHLDALVIGGVPVAEQSLIPALTGDDARLAFVSALALLRAEDGDHLPAIIEAVRADNPNAHSLGRALSLECRDRRAPRLEIAWRTADDTLRAQLIEPLAATMPATWLQKELTPCLHSSHAELRAAAWRRVWYAPQPAHASLATELLATELPAEVRHAVMVAALVSGAPQGWKTVRRVAEAPDLSSRVALALVCAEGDAITQRALYERFDAGDVSESLLWALGFAGTRDAAERLTTVLADRRLAACAAEAFSAITGLAIEGPYAVPNRPAAEPAPPEEHEHEDPEAPPPRVEAADFLTLPEPSAVRAWWNESKARFLPNVRYVAGAALGPAALAKALCVAPTWRREVYAVQHALNTRGPVKLELGTWARMQRAQLRTLL